jgi:prepilin-type N-terminal cleavage/methylation domain-containing protein
MLTRRAGRRDRQAGLTLIEILISMIVLSIVSTMLIAGWINLQRASAFAVRTNTARATARDAMSRVSSELRGAQPLTLPTASPSATATPTPQPVLVSAAPYSVTFYSSYNSKTVNADGSGTASLRLTRLWLDTGTAQPAPWPASARTLYWQKDTDNNGSFDRSNVLARNVVNSTMSTPVPLFRYGYRDADGNVVWTDNAGSSLDLSAVVAIQARVIVDANMARTPSYVDIITTIRPRNASSD